MRLLTADQMRALDQATIASGHASGETLMERAGAGVAAALERRYGPVLALRVLVLCGPGNNGGDGFVAARHLIARGAHVRVGLVGERSNVHGDAATHLSRLEQAGATVVAMGSEADLAALVGAEDAWDFAVDALLGTGSRGEPEGVIAAVVQALRELDELGTRVVAVDLPTGMNPDTGAIARRAVRADLTVTFGAPKRGHYLYPGRAFTGALEVVDIGLLAPQPGAALEVATEDAMAALLPVRDPRAHKGSAGRVVVVGGSAGLTGAVVLAARAATRSGAGYVQCCVPRSLHDVLAVKLTEEMVIPCAESPARAFSLEAMGAAVAAAERSDAVVLGSGLSRDPQAAELARRLVTSRTRPMVLDADGLNAFEGKPEFGAHAGRPLVLTPHLGEMSRLSGEAPQALESRRIEAASECAARWNAVLVLKGAPTVTAAPDGTATLNPTGNPGMATAGTGDVLAGMIGAFLAQGLAPYDAARLAVFVHGAAGDRAALERGVLSLAASDLIEALPATLLALAHARDEALGRRVRRS